MSCIVHCPLSIVNCTVIIIGHLDRLHPDHDIPVLTEVQHRVDRLLAEVREVGEEPGGGAVIIRTVIIVTIMMAIMTAFIMIMDHMVIMYSIIIIMFIIMIMILMIVVIMITGQHDRDHDDEPGDKLGAESLALVITLHCQQDLQILGSVGLKIHK